MTHGLLIYGEIFAHFLIYSIRKPFLIYDCSTLNFLIYEENLIFFLSVYHHFKVLVLVKMRETTYD
jgi:hypothetical protein